MKTATVDLSGCKYLDELHQRFQDALDFPEYYGKNLDAFWDCIRCDCDADFISIVGISKIANDLKPTIKKIISILEDNKLFWENSDRPFDYEILG